MKKIMSMLTALALSISSFTFVCAADTEAGTSEDNPILITTVSELNAIIGGESAGKYYRLENDISMGTTENLYEWNGWQKTTGDTPFKGYFDGNGHVISNYKVYQWKSGVGHGLFGELAGDAYIKNLGVENVNVITKNYYIDAPAAGLAGKMLDNSKILNCYAKNVTVGTEDGKTDGNETKYAGALIGYTGGAGVEIANCYTTGTVSTYANTNNYGDLVGCALQAKSITNCYSDNKGVVLPASNTTTETKNIYYVTAGWPNTWAGEKVTEDVLKTKAAELGEAFCADSEFTSINNGYPVLAWEFAMRGEGTEASPYLVQTADHLVQISELAETEGKYFKLMNDIDMNNTTLTSYIGTEANPFEGTFDGNGHVIKNYSIKIPAQDKLAYFGLFAYVGGDAVIKNVGIENITVNPAGTWGYKSVVGGLAAYVVDNARVEGCFVKNITFNAYISDTEKVNIAEGGGLIGNVNGAGVIVKNCYSTGFVTNELANSADVNYDGGLIGRLMSCSEITNCYADARLVRCETTDLKAKVTDSYYTGALVWPTGNYAGTSKTSDELKALASELGYAFCTDNTSVNSGYPVLAWECGVDVVAEVVFDTDGFDTASKVSSAKVEKWNEEAGQLIAATYTDGRMVAVKVCDVNDFGTYEVNLNIGDADTLKFFIMNLDTVKPLANVRDFVK